MREQKISSSYLTITSIVKLLSHLVLILPMMCGRLIIPQLLCLSSMERCCIRTIQWSSLPKKSLLSKACSEAAQEMSLCLRVMQHRKPGPSTATATTAVPTCHPAQEGRQVFELPARSTFTVMNAQQPHIGKMGGLRNRLCSGLLFWELGNALMELHHGRARKCGDSL